LQPANPWLRVTAQEIIGQAECLAEGWLYHLADDVVEANLDRVLALHELARFVPLGAEFCSSVE
jgi:hypothetical protein